MATSPHSITRSSSPRMSSTRSLVGSASETSTSSPSQGRTGWARSTTATAAAGLLRRPLRPLARGAHPSLRQRRQLGRRQGVAEVLADLATQPGSAGEQLSEVAGPREESLVDIAMLLASRLGHPLRIEGVSDPADPDRELNESDALLPGPGAILAGPTYEEWLDSTSWRVRSLLSPGRVLAGRRRRAATVGSGCPRDRGCSESLGIAVKAGAPAARRHHTPLTSDEPVSSERWEATHIHRGNRSVGVRLRGPRPSAEDRCCRGPAGRWRS